VIFKHLGPELEQISQPVLCACLSGVCAKANTADTLTDYLADAWLGMLGETNIRDYVAFFSRTASERLADNAPRC
jgi:hypothetical protein